MARFVCFLLWIGIALTPLAAATEPVALVHAVVAQPIKVIVIPVRSEIGDPALYVLRRGLKQAAAEHVDTVILDLNTPGGSVDSAFAMMETIEKFPGKTFAFVNNEAMSAGAFIAASTDEIWFAPRGVIGAAAAVTSQGQDIPETMRLKLTSFLRAKIRAVSQGKGYRGEVISAMIDKDLELKINDQVLKKPGELLSLTSSEAMAVYGKPAVPLLGAGIAGDIDALLTQKYGKNYLVVDRLHVTWSETLAQYLATFSPLLLGLGLLGLFVEFKMPSSGLFGGIGLALLVIVFLSSYVEGLSGHEPMLVFGLGLLCLLLELLLFPGVILPALLGVVLMLGSLVWALADVWPNQPIGSLGGTFAQPLADVGLGLLIAIVLGIILLRFLPKTWFFNRLVLTSSVGSSAQIAGISPEIALVPLIGRTGVVVTPLRPFGQVSIDGERYEARLAFGYADAGTEIVVNARNEFGLSVEKKP